MKIAVICPFNDSPSINYTIKVIKHLSSMKIDVFIDSELEKSTKIMEVSKKIKIFDRINSDFDFVFSIGGDGSMLHSVTKTQDSNIPILGINTGRLGFLTSLQKESLKSGINQLINSKYSIIKRSLLEVSIPGLNENIFDFNFALNEISVSRKNTASLISISSFLNDLPLTTFWADGLIIATPTGSTGYSLSSVGPIMTPQTSSFVLTPIAPHNINIRPLIINDDNEIKLQVTGRAKEHLISLDSRILTLPSETEILIKKAPFYIYTVELDDNSFINTLREKFFWGLDTRN